MDPDSQLHASDPRLQPSRTHADPPPPACVLHAPTRHLCPPSPTPPTSPSPAPRVEVSPRLRSAPNLRQRSAAQDSAGSR
ncbi:hypothetical protein B0H10DRAFT_2103189 [Mycena sp. CBHHK59/15]|nr:hypothetical protein B0H10DRAFT_2103189 [Mycena sp. CBHHK59/15]